MKLLKFVPLCLVLALAFLSCGQQQAAGDKPAFTVAHDATWPPMEYVDADKNIVGYSVDVTNAIAEAAGFTLVHKNAAWDGIFAALENGDFDFIASSVSITEERKAKYDFSAPYVSVGQILVCRTEATAAKLDDLKGKLVGAQIGTTGADEIKKALGDASLKNYDEIGLAMEDLKNGNIEGVVCDDPIAGNYALKNPNYEGKLKLVGTPWTGENYGLVVKQGNAKVLDLLNKGLETITKNGKLDEIKAKWFK
jgi:polar amino acid transport system substrate-binding protein